MPISLVKNQDCMLGMKEYPDKFFDLAIVDPPFGIGQNWKKDRNSKFYKHDSTYKNNDVPGADYFSELFRISTHQIIFGANYYTPHLPVRNSWIVWDKVRSFEDSHMAECELAWHSYNVPARIVKYIWNGFLRQEPRYGVHPHEKPVGLYKWLLQKYPDHGQKVLDTHLGSGSSRIAAHDMGFDFYGFELDKDYYEAQEKRFKQHIAQLTMFKNG